MTSAPQSRLRAWRDASALRGVLMVVAILTPIYAMTRTAPDQVNLDAEVAALPAWRLVQAGTIDLGGVEVENPFIVDGRDGFRASNRPLGLSLLAVPAYAVTNDATYSVNPSTVTAVGLTVAAMAVLYLVLRRITSHPWAIAAALAMGLATATWPISAAELWPHGPGQLAAAMALLAASSRRWLSSGIAFGFGVLIRPVTLIAGASMVAARALRTRWSEATALAVPIAIAVGMVATYNAAVFEGGLSITGGYSSSFRDRATDQSASGYLLTLRDTLISPQNGLLIWTPLLLLLPFGLARSWRDTPDWARDGAVAGVVYLLVHVRLNRASGGLLVDYRYPLEALTLAAPALTLAARSIVERSRTWRRLIVASLLISIGLQAAVAFTYECDHKPGQGGTCGLLA